MKAGIINVTGYPGVELARILSRHGDVEIASVTGRSAEGKRLGEVFPHLADQDLIITEELNGSSVDVVFSALPHAASAEKLGLLLAEGARVIDLSADFRLKNLDEYRRWYKIDHPYPEYIEEAVYGLTELHREEVASSRLVAVPGCFPTAAVLALAPAIEAGVIEPDIVVDAKTGVSGAGRSLSLTSHFSEINENVMAYSVDGHRHLPEIVQELDGIGAHADSPETLKVTFLSHLIPMTRGILASCYAPIRDGKLGAGEAARSEIREIYQDFYRDEPFARVVDAPPMTKQTLGNNACLIYPTVDLRTNRLIVVSCLDNLVKGAAGQAVQNMNLMFGLPEDQGLRQLALYP